MDAMKETLYFGISKTVGPLLFSVLGNCYVSHITIGSLRYANCNGKYKGNCCCCLEVEASHDKIGAPIRKPEA